MQIKLLDGTTRYLQNWQIDPLVYKDKNWNYMPFPIPPFSRKMGEDAQTVQLTIPNLGAREHGYLPIRDWIQNGQISGAFLDFLIFNGSNLIVPHTFVVAEQSIESSRGNSTNEIKLNLRQPDDRRAVILTATYNNGNLGEVPVF